MKKDLFGGFPGGRFIGQEELDEVAKVIKSRSPYRFYGLDLKKRVEALEKDCCKIFGRRYALAVSSGTAALHTALFSLGVSPSDEVIVPAYGWSADIMAILALNATPVIAPIDETLGLDASLLENCITKKTKAIIAIHMRGHPCDIKKIWGIGKKHGIGVIEDGAQCIGGKIDGAPVGATGDISILSFQYNKLVTCGEGGVLLTNDKDIYQRAYRFHDLGMFRQPGEADPEGPDAIGSFGLNYRLSELQAAFLISQLKKIPGILKSLKISYKMAEDNLLSICKELSLGVRKTPLNCIPNHAFLCLCAHTEKAADKAQEALRRLKVPIERSSRLDGHNFRVWKEYMKREKRRFRVIGETISNRLLKRSFYIEINSSPKL